MPGRSAAVEDRSPGEPAGPLKEHSCAKVVVDHPLDIAPQNRVVAAGVVQVSGPLAGIADFHGGTEDGFGVAIQFDRHMELALATTGCAFLPRRLLLCA